MMIYEFFKIYEMNFSVKVFEVKARDLHEAKMKAILNGSEYDYLTINGVYA